MTNGILNTLTLEDIQKMEAETRTRGEYARLISEFFESGELAVDVSMKFPSKSETSLRTSIDQNIRKLAASDNSNVPAYKLMLVPNGDRKHVILVNMDVYHLQSQADEV